MKELIDRLQTEAGISQEQATKALEILKDFAKEKFPMFGSAIDSAFSRFGDDEDPLP